MNSKGNAISNSLGEIKSNGFRLYALLAMVCLLLCMPNLNAQEYFKEDSLHSVYNSSEDVKSRVNALIDLSNLHGSNDVKKSLIYAKKALDESLQSDDYVMQAIAYSNLGISFMNIGSYDKATQYFLESKGLIEQHDDIKRLAGILVNLGAVRFMLDDMEGALQNYSQALELNHKLLAMGDSVYMDQIQVFYINIGSVYDRLENNEAAIQYMNQAVEASKSKNDLYHLSKANNNLGEIYIRLKDYNRARTNILNGLRNRQQIKDLNGMASSYLNLTDLYLALEKVDSAVITNGKAVQLGEELGSYALLKSAYEQKAAIFEKRNDYKTANEALKQYYAVKDSLINESVIENTTSLQMEYEFSKIDEERIREHKLFRIKMFATLASLVAFLTGFVLLFFLWRSRAERIEVERQNLEKDLELKNKELTTNVMYLLKKNELIGKVSERLLTLKSKMKPENKSSLQSIIFDLQAGADSDVWEEFELRFQQVHNDFYERLQESAPDLTPSELKLCAFLKLGMNSKEIATLIHQSPKSIEVKRSKIRKKLGLTNTDTNLTTYLNQL